MYRSCKYCGRIHPIGEQCPARPRREIKERTEIARFRSTWAWTQKAIRIKERDHHLCRMCLAAGKLSKDNLEVHHIVPVAENWDSKLDDDNLITLCDSCHEAAEQGGIPRKLLCKLAAEGIEYPPGE